MALLLYTGQRRSDLVTMGPQHVDKNGAIHVRQVKTGVTLVILVHSALQTIIDATVTEQPPPAANVVPLAKPFLTTAFGRAFTSNGFGNWFRTVATRLGCPQCSAHGLRKASATAGRSGMHCA